jgi:DHA1 family tetracycline resistance protein-like MFS transporter
LGYLNPNLHGGGALVFAGIAALTFVYGFFVLPESLPDARRRRLSFSHSDPLGAPSALKRPADALPLMLATVFSQLSVIVDPPIWHNLSGGFHAEDIFSGASVAIALVAFTSAMIVKYGEARAARISAAIGVLFFAFQAPDYWFFYPLLYPMLLLGGLRGIAMPLINAAMSRQVAPERQGALQGRIAGAMGLSVVLGAVAVTVAVPLQAGCLVFRRFSPNEFLIAAGSSLLCFAVLRLRSGSLIPGASSAP